MKKSNDAIVKTNAMRQLEAAGIAFRTATYAYEDHSHAGIFFFLQVGMMPAQDFKTLVTRGDKTGILVFCIPVDQELDLKKAAAVSGNKKLEMTQVKELLGLTGYIRGGCSPIGMKKKYPTFLDQTALQFDEIAVSAGKQGEQILLSPDTLIQFVQATVADITKPM